MVVQAMTHQDVYDKVDTYTLDDALRHIDTPLCVTFVAIGDTYTIKKILYETEERISAR